MLRHLMCLIVALVVVSPTIVVAQEARFPDSSWEHGQPVDLSLDPARLEAVETALGGRGCIVKDGWVVRAWGDQAEKSDWYSSAKPVLSTLLMFAIREGRVESPDARIADFGWNLAEKDRPMTFRHLASMTSGYARPEPPGEAWAYNDFAIQLYQKTLFDRVFKEEPDVAANAPHRLGALQLEDGLSFRPSNRRISGSVRDLARIAWFWLHRGRWNGKELLPSAYFDDWMKPQVPKDLPHTRDAQTDDYLRIGTYGGDSDHFTAGGPGVYGFNWWFNETGRLHTGAPTWPGAPPDTVMSVGAMGNCSVLIPSLKLVVVGLDADWGPLAPGDAEAKLNRQLKLIADAGTPRS